jgi:hypothetical protein
LCETDFAVNHQQSVSFRLKSYRAQLNTSAAQTVAVYNFILVMPCSALDKFEGKNWACNLFGARNLVLKHLGKPGRLAPTTSKQLNV